jgi:ribosomal protein S18 acetylase RimI-like enzyme
VRTSRLCGPDDLVTVVDILVDSFDDDPTWSWVFPDPARRPEQLRVVWTALVAGAMRYQTVWLAAGDTATSVWIPPGGLELSEEQDEALRGELRELLGDEALRVFRVLDAFEQAQPHHEPHYVLSLLGTASQHRGHGYGLGLLAENLVVVDDADMAAYLEASHPANVGLYERYGFEIFGAFSLPDGGHDVTTMWRPRRSSRANG